MTAAITHPFGETLTIERHRLDNGLTVLLLIDESAPVVSYQTWFRVGSRHEREGKTGIAHLFEHLMFNETERFGYGEYDRVLEEAGADNNAATYLDWTYYLINLPKDALALTIELEAERMQRLVVRDAQVESELEVVSNERRETVDDDVDGSIGELLFQTAFDVHSYRFPTIGTMADIEGMTTEDCVAFYAEHYAPNNATVVIVGDVEAADVLSQVRRAYADISAASLSSHEPAPEPEQTEERRVRVSKATESARLAIGYRSPAMGDPDHVALTLLNEVIFGGRGSRAYQTLVEEREVASDVSAYVGNFRDPALWEIYLTGNAGLSVDDLAAALDAVIDDVHARPISEDELARARARLELSALQELETASGKAEAIGFAELVLGDPAALFTRLEAYRLATCARVTAAATHYLQPTRRTVIEVIPEAGDDGPLT